MEAPLSASNINTQHTSAAATPPKLPPKSPGLRASLGTPGYGANLASLIVDCRASKSTAAASPYVLSSPAATRYRTDLFFSNQLQQFRLRPRLGFEEVKPWPAMEQTLD